MSCDGLNFTRASKAPARAKTLAHNKRPLMATPFDTSASRKFRGCRWVHALKGAFLSQKVLPWRHEPNEISRYRMPDCHRGIRTGQRAGFGRRPIQAGKARDCRNAAAAAGRPA